MSAFVTSQVRRKGVFAEFSVILSEKDLYVCISPIIELPFWL